MHETIDQADIFSSILSTQLNRSMKRRSFLRTSGLLAAIPYGLNGQWLSTFSRIWPQESDRILVLIQLNGGNDGLGCVVPIADYDRLYQVRPKLMVPQPKLLPVDDQTALHPSLSGIRQLYDEGLLGIAQGVGYPEPNRSHFRSLDIMTSGSPSDEIWQSGWLGRYREGLEQSPILPDPDPYAITMGYSISNTCQGKISNFSTALVDPLATIQVPAGGRNVEPPFSRHREEMEYIRMISTQTLDHSRSIKRAAQLGSNRVSYPDTELGRQLQSIAQLISGGLQTQVYITHLSGFDTHADQIQPESNGLLGRQPELLTDLSQCIHAFTQDLARQQLDHRVFGMTFSEFGRQIRANESNGTDHGDASAVFYFGGKVNPAVIGSSPAIPEEVPDQAALTMQLDIRDVYQTILTDWFGASTASSPRWAEGKRIPLFRG